MRIYITKQEGNYYFNREGQEPIRCEVKQPKGWDETVFLPENETNRKLINKAKLDKALEKADEFELTVKAPVTIGQRSSVPKKPDIEYLDDNDKILYQELMDKIAKARADEKAKAKAKAKDPKEILRQKIARYEAQLKAMENE